MLFFFLLKFESYKLLCAHQIVHLCLNEKKNSKIECDNTQNVFFIVLKFELTLLRQAYQHIPSHLTH